VPLNDAMEAAGDPDEIDLATVRAVACTVALGCLARALVEFGRM
jgi:hypothetical protein